MESFLNFINKKNKQAGRKLNIVKNILESKKFKVDSFIEETDDPYVFVYSHKSELSFEGIRIYLIGDSVAYRVQNEKEAHPYGKSYLLDVEGIYEELMEDGVDKEAGQKVIESIFSEIKKFFENSVDAEDDIRSNELDSAGIAMVSSPSTDYADLANK